MQTLFVRRTILFISLAVLAASWPSSAVGAQREGIRPPAQADERTMPEILDRLWSFLRGKEGKEGCGIDPFGRCAPEQPAHRKAGCNIDPWGRCIP